MCRDVISFDQWNMSGSLTYSKQLLAQPSSPLNSWAEFPTYGIATGDIPDYGGSLCQPLPLSEKVWNKSKPTSVHRRSMDEKESFGVENHYYLGCCFHSMTLINSSQKLLHIRIIWRTLKICQG